MERKIIYASDAAEAVSKAYNITLHELVDLFAEVPTVEPKHGTWIEKNTYYKCSNCWHQIMDTENFCPNCGADMGGSKDD